MYLTFFFKLIYGWIILINFLFNNLIRALSPSKKLYKFVANNGLPEAPTDAKWMEIIPSGE